MNQWNRPGAVIPLASVANLRDLGGWRTRDGRMVRHGLLFRSAELDNLADDDLQAFERPGIRTIYDLRTEVERAAQPDRVPDGVEHVVVDVLADSFSSAAAQVIEVPTDPKEAEELLGGGLRRPVVLSRLPGGGASAERAAGLSAAVLRACPARPSPDPVPLHHRQGPHRLGGSGDADVAGSVRPGRDVRIYPQ